MLLLLLVSLEFQQHDSACTMRCQIRVVPEYGLEDIWAPPSVCDIEESIAVIPHPKLF